MHQARAHVKGHAHKTEADSGKDCPRGPSGAIVRVVSTRTGRSTAGARAAREELRVRRQQAILQLALDIVTTEGHDGLTMQRLADDLECGIASVYRLFPSKDALIAELLHDALDVLHAAWLLGLSHVDEANTRKGLDDATAALSRAVASAWFWVVADQPYASQMDLARRLFIDRKVVVPTEQAASILPATLRLLDLGRQTIDGAAEAGALEPGNGIERSIILIASVTGVVQTGKFGRWDASLFDARRLAGLSICDDFVAWGARRDAVTIAMDLAVELAEAGLLAPAVPR